MYKNQINEILDLVASLRRCSCEDCKGESCFGNCDEHENRLMRNAADMLEVCAETLSEQNRTVPDSTGQYTMMEIIRMVQRVTSDTLDSLYMDDYSRMWTVREVEHGIIAELVKGETE